MGSSILGQPKGKFSWPQSPLEKSKLLRSFVENMEAEISIVLAAFQKACSDVQESFAPPLRSLKPLNNTVVGFFSHKNCLIASFGFVNFREALALSNSDAETSTPAVPFEKDACVAYLQSCRESACDRVREAFRWNLLMAMRGCLCHMTYFPVLEYFNNVPG